MTPVSVQSAEPPALSVVIPVHQGAYLQPMLQSVAAQSFRDLEIIVVVDGADPGVLRVLENARDQFPRLTIVPLQHRGGAGRARNIGLEVAAGRFIAFADADDVLPSDAYMTLVAALEDSGDDVASGRATQFHEDGTELPYWTTDGLLHADWRKGLTLKREPMLCGDHTPWNKVFSADALRRLHVRFPEGTTSEDLAFWVDFVTRARVSVVPETVYRHRRHQASVTGALAEVRELRDWGAQSQAAIALLAERSGPAVLETYFDRLLSREAWTRVRRLESMSADARNALRDIVAALLDIAPDATVARLSPVRSWSYHLLASGAVDAAVELQELREHADPDRWMAWMSQADVLDVVGDDVHTAAESFWRETMFFPCLQRLHREETGSGVPELIEFHDRLVASFPNEHEEQVFAALRSSRFGRARRMRQLRGVRVSAGLTARFRSFIVEAPQLTDVPPGESLRARLVLVGKAGERRLLRSRPRLRSDELDRLRAELVDGRGTDMLVTVRLLDHRTAEAVR